ncbi:hypothetical protein H6G20_11640 [Desertifilum sp. FACHB-1129]|uniref:Uncharacterized protein n=1 Tax=Desertifilum tharense IPPAS B-1220 TaxID=1781255 RepID=A0A1E5QCF8_9CYAN|nr:MULTISPECIES: hypothetical protein [Desertifilum]MCD8486941.1 hypothetical protein [Desertifilum sp.]MDA0210828.1 hypothetical protein [Cyanobacteria bacterium FC1]MBD2312314.1 hypothetical protein [Desertifilum sp. FACHB-1129]MBD2322278.1 hypothetical protein [Desertifilum sp. FACHB-866]MBD2332315.1 hypothetical protein [Desertifilum sp. FACHB-868]
MPADLRNQKQMIIEDLKFLIAELEQNPQVSPWVINLALRSVKHKVALWGAQTNAQKIELERLIQLSPPLSESQTL